MEPCQSRVYAFDFIATDPRRYREEDKRIRIEGRHFHLSRSLFYMPPELMPHRGQNPIGKIRVAA